jgi:hypothetical protein
VKLVLAAQEFAALITALMNVRPLAGAITNESREVRIAEVWTAALRRAFLQKDNVLQAVLRFTALHIDPEN